MSDIRQFYDLTAKQTAEEWYPNAILMPTIRDFLTLLPDRPRVLDLGCGPGYESMRMHSLGAEVVGVDFSPRSIEIARQRNPDCMFVTMDFFDITDSIGQFDGVFASGSLIHVPAERMASLLMRLAAVVTAGGILAMIVQDGTGKRVSQRTVADVSFERVVHLYKAEDITQYCHGAGFMYLRRGFLDKSLEPVWRCHLVQRV